MTIPDAGERIFRRLQEILAISPTLYCDSGRPDRTLEMAPDDLANLIGARFASFSKGAPERSSTASLPTSQLLKCPNKSDS